MLSMQILRIAAEVCWCLEEEGVVLGEWGMTSRLEVFVSGVAVACIYIYI